jgi:hypothetical protein
MDPGVGLISKPRLEVTIDAEPTLTTPPGDDSSFLEPDDELLLLLLLDPEVPEKLVFPPLVFTLDNDDISPIGIAVKRNKTFF